MPQKHLPWLHADFRGMFHSGPAVKKIIPAIAIAEFLAKPNSSSLVWCFYCRWLSISKIIISRIIFPTETPPFLQFTFHNPFNENSRNLPSYRGERAWGLQRFAVGFILQSRQSLRELVRTDFMDWL